MASLNKVMLIGCLGRDPELKYTNSGMPVVTLNIATNEYYTDKEGNRTERTEWHRVSAFQRQAENCATYLKKGSWVFVEGSLQTRKWQDQQGNDRYTTEIRAQRVQFLDRKGDSQPASEGSWDNDQPRQPKSQPRKNTPPPMLEDLGSPFPSEAGPLDDRDEVPF